MPLPYSNNRAAGDDSAVMALLEDYAAGKVQELGGLDSKVQQYDLDAGIASRVQQHDLDAGLASVKDGLLAKLPKHGGTVSPLVDQVMAYTLGGKDETGEVSIGANGISLNRAAANGRPGWSLSANPVTGTAQYNRGDLEIGADFLQRSGRIRKGGFSVEGGYGSAPGAFGPETGKPAELIAQPGAWGKVSFEVGSKPRKNSSSGLGAEIDRAVAPWGMERPAAGVVEPSARELADEQSRSIRAQRGGINPLYW